MINAEKIVGNDRQGWIKVWFNKPNKTQHEAMLTVPGALYDVNRKIWAVPYGNRATFERIMGGFLINWADEDKNNGGIDEDYIPREPVVPGYEVEYGEDGSIISAKGFKRKPWGEFQVKGFNLMVSRDFLILADDAGLGKTWQVATAIEAKKKLGQVKYGIIVCKASLLSNWRDEIHLNTNERAIVVAGTQKQRFSIYSDLRFKSDWTFIVMSYETYRQDIPNLQLLDNHRPLDFCVLDEAHKIKNSQSQIGGVIHFLPFRVRYVLTATPLPNDPLESHNYLKWGKKTELNWFEFRGHFALMGGYGGTEIVAYQNIPELKKLIQLNMLRRRKKDKLKDLPDAVSRTITIQLTDKQRKTYNAVKYDLMEDLKDTTLDKVPTALTKLLRLQQVTDSLELIGVEPHKNNSSKMEALHDLIEELVEQNGQKVIIFSRFREMVSLIEKAFAHHNPAVIHGDVDANGKTVRSAERILKKEHGDAWDRLTTEQKNKFIDDKTTSDRQKQVYKFQEDNSCKVFIGCTPACREGLTLTAATHVIFLDCEWSPAYVEQAWSRAHRIGQKCAVTIHFIVCEDTIDEYIQVILEQKEAMAQVMLDEGIEAIGAMQAKEFISRMAGVA